MVDDDALKKRCRFQVGKSVAYKDKSGERVDGIIDFLRPTPVSRDLACYWLPRLCLLGMKQGPRSSGVWITKTGQWRAQFRRSPTDYGLLGSLVVFYGFTAGLRDTHQVYGISFLQFNVGMYGTTIFRSISLF